MAECVGELKLHAQAPIELVDFLVNIPLPATLDYNLVVDGRSPFSGDMTDAWERRETSPARQGKERQFTGGTALIGSER